MTPCWLRLDRMLSLCTACRCTGARKSLPRLPMGRARSCSIRPKTDCMSIRRSWRCSAHPRAISSSGTDGCLTREAGSDRMPQRTSGTHQAGSDYDPSPDRCIMAGNDLVTENFMSTSDIDQPFPAQPQRRSLTRSLLIGFGLLLLAGALLILALNNGSETGISGAGRALIFAPAVFLA